MSEPEPHRKEFDVAIAGGGMVGLTLAIALASGGVRVAVVDVLDPDEATAAAFDGRVSSIALASSRMYEALGVWPHLENQAQPINDILVTDGRLSEGASPFFLHFDHREIGDAPLGYMVENRHLRIALLKAAGAVDGLTLIAPERVAGLDMDGAGVEMRLADGSAIAASVAVAAEGRNSPLRESAGIKTVGWSYNQKGIVVTVEHELPHDGLAQEYFLPSGPFAILPMTGNRSSLVWTERSELADAIMALDEAGFTAELRKRFGDYLGDCVPVGPKWSYPLGLQLARNYFKDRLVLVGDAAHAMHPIAGQGLNMGLRDAAALAEAVVDAARLGLDIGGPTVLERYQRWRRFDNVVLAAATDGLNRLFSNDAEPVRLLRDIGLGLVNRIGPLRKYFMSEAGGLTGELPKLMRGEAL